MHRFYCPDLPPPPDVSAAVSSAAAAPPLLSVNLGRDQARHARQVLRLQPGQDIEVFDGWGRLVRGRIVEWVTAGDGPRVNLRLTSTAQLEPALPIIDVAAAIPKGPTADLMVNQLTQLGVGRLIPMHSERSVVEPRPAKLDRFARVVIEACKQCGRNHLMTIDQQQPFATVVLQPCDLMLIAAPEAAPLADLPQQLRVAQRVLILVGPEGGWTPDELDMAQRVGALRWGLNPHVLRISTAAVAAAAIARYLVGCQVNLAADKTQMETDENY